MSLLELNQVWLHREYFKIISSLTETDVEYEFFNRKEWFFEPNKRRKLIDHVNMSQISVSTTRKKFLLDIRMNNLVLMDTYFGKLPNVGIDASYFKKQVYLESDGLMPF